MKKLLFCLCLVLYFITFSWVEATYIDYQSLKGFEYIICIDGGGRKTELQILDRQGSPLRIKKGGKISTSCFGPSSNISNVGEIGFGEMLDTLLEDILVGPEQQSIGMIRKKSIIVAGFPGLSSASNKEVVRQLFEKRGFLPNQLLIFTDAQIALDLVNNRGAVLIGGTDTICMGLYQNNEFRAGGFGKALPNGGSAYSIGIATLRAALEDELGYGESTPLTAACKKQLGVSDLQEAITRVNTGQIPAGKIAELALKTAAFAQEGDVVSKKVMDQAMEELAMLIINVIKRMPGKDPTPVYLIGGLFEHEYPVKKQIEEAEVFKNFKKQYSGAIELHNVSRRCVAAEVVTRCLKRTDAPMAFLNTLPEGCLPYKDFEDTFGFDKNSTEKSHPLTRRLSQTMNQDIEHGMELLLGVDEMAYESLNQHIDRILSILTPSLTRTFKDGGRILLVGSGASGRAAIDLAAKCNRFSPKYGNQVQGLICGGDSCVIRSKEGAEESEIQAKLSIGHFNLTSQDTVLIISGSGATTFSIHAAHAAANAGARVFYFYNSAEIPQKAQALFHRPNNPCRPLLIDTGPQAITGSTRLQSANVALYGVGTALAVSLLQAQDLDHLAEHYVRKQVENICALTTHLKSQIPNLKKLAQNQVNVFSDIRANFRKITDVTNRGYVTIICDKKSIREAIMDTCPASSNFSTNYPRRNSEPYRKREEFRAYLFDEKTEAAAWETVLGRPIREEDVKDTCEFILSAHSTGVNSYQQRPIGPGNYVIGTFNIAADEPLSPHVLEALKQAKQKGTLTAAIVVSARKLSEADKTALKNVAEDIVYLDGLMGDEFGITQTLAMKMSLNLISSSSMVLMNKVYGNHMIDVRASTHKLIGRCIRICRTIWNESFPDKRIDDKSLYHYIQHVTKYKMKKQSLGIYTPSVVKIVLHLLYHEKGPNDLDEVVEKIVANQERLDFLNKI